MQPSQTEPRGYQRWAIVATVVALVCVNLAVAVLLARAVGASSSLIPESGVWVLLAAGVALGGVAVALWRRFLAASQAAGDHPAGASTTRNSRSRR